MNRTAAVKPYRVSELCKLYGVHSLTLEKMMRSKGLGFSERCRSDEDNLFSRDEVRLILEKLGYPNVFTN